MPDDIIRCFLEQLVECTDAISDALRYLLHYYYMNLENEKEAKRQQQLPQKEDEPDGK